MRVFRVEHKETRNGPFTGPGCPAHNIDFYFEPPDHPGPFADGIDTMADRVCGTRDMALLRHWFDRENLVDKLKEIGYHVVEFEAKEVATGYTQVAFNRSRATVINTFSPDILKE